jgi:hypothetical protein
VSRVLLMVWLRDAANDRRDRANKALDSFNRLENPTTPYALAMATIANCHLESAAVYERQLAKSKPEESE